MKRSLRRLLVLAVVAFLATSPGTARAGLFKNLLEKVGKTMEDYNNDMWTGENSVGKTVLKHEGGFFKTFEDTAAALGRAQDNAKANVKAVWEAVKDIVLWLPRKIGAAFEKLMDGVRNFMGKLGQMNQGGSVKERWNNMVGVSNGAGGGAAPQAFSAPPSGGQAGVLPEDELDALLSDDAGARGSADAEAAYAELPPPDAPAAPGGEGEAGNFSKMIRLTGAIEESGKQREARKRIRRAYVGTLDQALASGDVDSAASLIKANGALYEGNPDGMEKAMGILAKRHPRYARGLSRSAGRMANMARRASHSP